jgi:hypothetical protein
MSIVPNKYVAYLPELSPTALQRFLSHNRLIDKVPAIRLFLARYRIYPCLLSCPKAESNALFHISSILNYLKDQFGHEIINDLIARKYHMRAKQFYVKYVFKQRNFPIRNNSFSLVAVYVILETGL